jgi:hypothetical protein
VPSPPAISRAYSTATREQRVPLAPQTMRANGARTSAPGPEIWSVSCDRMAKPQA